MNVVLIKRNSTTLKLYLYIYTVTVFTPILNKNNELLIALVGIFYLIIIYKNELLSRLFSFRFIPIYLWMIYSILLKILDYSHATWGNFFLNFIFFFPFFLYGLVEPLLSYNEKIRLLYFSAIVLILNIFSNIYLIKSYPNILDSYNYVGADVYVNLNIGTTIYTGLIMLFSQFLFWSILYDNKKKITLMFLVICMVYIFLTEKTTTIVLTFYGFFLIIINHFFFLKAGAVKIKKMLIIIIGLFIGLQLMGFFISIIDSERISVRLETVENLDFSDTYFGRLDLARISLESFADSPIIGIGNQKEDINGDLDVSYRIGIGQHSEFIDHLARYGIIGLMFYLWIYYYYKKSIRMIIKNRKLNLFFTSMMALFFLYSILNNSFTAGTGFLVFFLLPLFINTKLNKL
jgi:hypothetical protein